MGLKVQPVHHVVGSLAESASPGASEVCIPSNKTPASLALSMSNSLGNCEPGILNENEYLAEIYLGHLSDDYVLNRKTEPSPVPKAQPSSSAHCPWPSQRPSPSPLASLSMARVAPPLGRGLAARALHLAPETVCPNWELPLPHTDGRQTQDSTSRRHQHPENPADPAHLKMLKKVLSRPD